MLGDNSCFLNAFLGIVYGLWRGGSIDLPAPSPLLNIDPDSGLPHERVPAKFCVAVRVTLERSEGGVARNNTAAPRDALRRWLTDGAKPVLVGKEGESGKGHEMGSVKDLFMLLAAGLRKDAAIKSDLAVRTRLRVCCGDTGCVKQGQAIKLSNTKARKDGVVIDNHLPLSVRKANMQGSLPGVLGAAVDQLRKARAAPATKTPCSGCKETKSFITEVTEIVMSTCVAVVADGMKPRDARAMWGSVVDEYEVVSGIAGCGGGRAGYRLVAVARWLGSHFQANVWLPRGGAVTSSAEAPDLVPGATVPVGDWYRCDGERVDLFPGGRLDLNRDPDAEMPILVYKRCDERAAVEAWAAGSSRGNVVPFLVLASRAHAPTFQDCAVHSVAPPALLNCCA
jgi:hypothetical protein